MEARPRTVRENKKKESQGLPKKPPTQSCPHTPALRAHDSTAGLVGAPAGTPPVPALGSRPQARPLLPLLPRAAGATVLAAAGGCCDPAHPPPFTTTLRAVHRDARSRPGPCPRSIACGDNSGEPPATPTVPASSPGSRQPRGHAGPSLGDGRWWAGGSHERHAHKVCHTRHAQSRTTTHNHARRRTLRTPLAAHTCAWTCPPTCRRMGPPPDTSREGGDKDCPSLTPTPPPPAPTATTLLSLPRTERRRRPAHSHVKRHHKQSATNDPTPVE